MNIIKIITNFFKKSPLLSKKHTIPKTQNVSAIYKTSSIFLNTLPLESHIHLQYVPKQSIVKYTLQLNKNKTDNFSKREHSHLEYLEKPTTQVEDFSNSIASDSFKINNYAASIFVDKTHNHDAQYQKYIQTPYSDKVVENASLFYSLNNTVVFLASQNHSHGTEYVKKGERANSTNALYSVKEDDELSFEQMSLKDHNHNATYYTKSGAESTFVEKEDTVKKSKKIQSLGVTFVKSVYNPSKNYKFNLTLTGISIENQFAINDTSDVYTTIFSNYASHCYISSWNGVSGASYSASDVKDTAPKYIKYQASSDKIEKMMNLLKLRYVKTTREYKHSSGATMLYKTQDPTSAGTTFYSRYFLANPSYKQPSIYEAGYFVYKVASSKDSSLMGKTVGFTLNLLDFIWNISVNIINSMFATYNSFLDKVASVRLPGIPSLKWCSITIAFVTFSYPCGLKANWWYPFEFVKNFKVKYMQKFMYSYGSGEDYIIFKQVDGSDIPLSGYADSKPGLLDKFLFLLIDEPIYKYAVVDNAYNIVPTTKVKINSTSTNLEKTAFAFSSPGIESEISDLVYTLKQFKIPQVTPQAQWGVIISANSSDSEAKKFYANTYSFIHMGMLGFGFQRAFINNNKTEITIRTGGHPFVCSFFHF